MAKRSREHHTPRTSLANRRKDIGFTQEELAEKIQVEVRSVRSWEGGENFPHLRNRRALAEALKVDLEEIERLLRDDLPPLSATVPKGQGRDSPEAGEGVRVAYAAVRSALEKEGEATTASIRQALLWLEVIHGYAVTGERLGRLMGQMTRATVITCDEIPETEPKDGQDCTADSPR